MLFSAHGFDAHGYRGLADNTGARLNARHTVMIAAWRQVLHEAGGQVPDRNIERLLVRTHTPVPPGDLRRLDIVAPGLNAVRGLPLFCDVTIVSPHSRNGQARGGTSNQGGRLLDDAEIENNETYPEVVSSGVGALFCLGAEVYGRWGTPCVKLVPKLARDHAKGLHPRIRRGAALAYQHRWWGILSIALQKSVAHAVLRDAGEDLADVGLDAAPALSDLPAQ